MFLNKLFLNSMLYSHYDMDQFFLDVPQESLVELYALQLL